MTRDGNTPREVSADVFARAFNYARVKFDVVREATSPFEAIPDTRYYLGDVTLPGGYAIRADGELVYVFTTARGHGDALVRAAIVNGATHLDCFDGYLPTFYARHGFTETHREPNWTPDGPDVVWMERT